jgi:predicted small lipoprotein YifL
MKAGLITVFVLVLAGLLSGCGQKGPLYQDEYPGEQAGAEAEKSSTPENDDRSR